MKGADLVGLRYEPMWPQIAAFIESDDELRPHRDALWQVVAADYVTTEDGTGIVHTAPAFGADDFSTGQKHGLGLLNPMRARRHVRADCST